MEIKKANKGDKNSSYLRHFKLEYRASHNKLYGFAFKFNNSKLFQLFIILMILVNTIVLAMDKYPEEGEQQQTLEQFNYFFSTFFMFELLLKLVALGFYGFFIDPYNIFDAVIVVASMADIIISQIVVKNASSVIIAIRAFRLLRLFKLAKQWKRLSHLLSTILRTFGDVGTFSILLFLFMFTFSLLGMETYANRVKFAPDNSIDLENGTSPDSNFDSLLNSFATVFVVLTADGWSNIYFNHYRAIENEWSTIYFIMLIIIGQRVLLNLFLAILLQNFDENNLRE